MFGATVENCPECHSDHVVGDVRGEPCFACSVAKFIRDQGGSEEDARAGFLSARDDMILELSTHE